MNDGPPLKIMEVCGTHTRSIAENGIRSLIPSRIELVSGPGCPVCVTVAAYIDRIIEYSLMPGHVVVTFGDMMRVAGSGGRTLNSAKAVGGSIRMVYSPFDTIGMAQADPDNTYIFAAVGFETTLTAYALVVRSIVENRISNVKLLTAIKTIKPALDFVCAAQPEISAFIAPGHVSVVTGYGIYESLAAKYKRPFTVSGFKGAEIMAAIADLVKQCANGTYEVHNHYKGVVTRLGNLPAQTLIEKYFEPGDAAWRGFPIIPGSALYLRPEFASIDAGSKGLDSDSEAPAGCICGSVIAGKARPRACPLFMRTCRPGDPVGACMATGEGACLIEAETSGEVRH
jgi:hydrogenase expression/formation protein HypD